MWAKPFAAPAPSTTAIFAGFPDGGGCICGVDTHAAMMKQQRNIARERNLHFIIIISLS
jgi:hypothetical protein